MIYPRKKSDDINILVKTKNFLVLVSEQVVQVGDSVGSSSECHDAPVISLCNGFEVEFVYYLQ